MDLSLRALGLAAVMVLAGCSSSDAGGAAQPSPSTSPSPSASASAGPVTDAAYVALGDSVAAGVGATDPARGGYVPLLAQRLSGQGGCDVGPAGGCPVANLAVPGATTANLLREQLPAALDLLRDGDVRLVTVTVGGNDVFVPVLRACAGAPEAPGCAASVRAALGAVDQGLDRVLGELTAAAGPQTRVAVMTYYDPLAACRLAPLQPLAGQVLEGSGDVPGLNDVLRARAAEHGALVAETSQRLVSPADFVGGLDCLHPSASGHARIADAFVDALDG